MSRIDDLLAEHCPGGVVHKPLGEVAGYSTTRVEQDDLEATNFVGVDNLLRDRGGRVDAAYSPNTTSLTAFEAGDILLGNIRPYLKKVWLADRSGGCSGDVLAIRIREACRPQLLPSFLCDVLSTERFFAFNMRYAKGAKMPRGDKKALLQYRIPLPPVDIQAEVSRILRAFGKRHVALEAELDAELRARSQAYLYYRDALLRFDQENVEWSTLGAVAANLDAQRRPITKSARVPGKIPYYGASGVVDYVQDYIFDGEYLLVSEDGANLLARSSPIAFSISGKTWVNNHAHVLKFGSLDEQRFIEMYLNSIDLAPYVGGGAQPKLTKANLNRIPVPVPNADERARTVHILSKLETLTADLIEGLRSERSARHQQHEYYRDRLLTFEDLTAKPADTAEAEFVA